MSIPPLTFVPARVTIHSMRYECGRKNGASPRGRLIVAALTLVFLIPSCSKGKGSAEADPVIPATSEARPPEAQSSIDSETPEMPDGSGSVPDGSGSTPDGSGSTPTGSEPIELPRPIMRTLVVKDELKPGLAAGADLLIPGGTESARLPFDFAIGGLGEGKADSAAYRFALSFVTDLAATKDVSALFLERGKTESAAAANVLRPIAPKVVRLGGGLPLEGGSLSFLVRFMGDASSVTGELRLSPSDGAWRVSILLLDIPEKDVSSEGESRFDPFSYKRFL